MFSFSLRQGLLPAQLMQMSDDIVLNRNFVKCLLNTCQPKAQISRVHTHSILNLLSVHRNLLLDAALSEEFEVTVVMADHEIGN